MINLLYDLCEGVLLERWTVFKKMLDFVGLEGVCGVGEGVVICKRVSAVLVAQDIITGHTRYPLLRTDWRLAFAGLPSCRTALGQHTLK